MTAVIQSLTASPAWKSLETHQERVRELHLRKLFSDDPKRGERMTVEAMGIYLDYSKNQLTEIGRRYAEFVHVFEAARPS
jgi:glucose-6-phosphate isomerase